MRRHPKLRIYREILFNLLGDKCSCCSSEERLLIHHKDLDFNNNKFKNAQLLCKKCHDNLHTKIKKEAYHLWICPRCRKKIRSLSYDSLDMLCKHHLATHDKKNPKEEV